MRPIPASADVRVYAVGYKHLVEDAESYESYRGHLATLAEQALASRDPAGVEKVLVFPEDTALYALFIGARGQAFRALQPLLVHGGGFGADAALAGLFGAYQAQAAYYRVKFPKQNLSETRLGLLALTDTLYRSFFETFRAIARSNGAWVVAAANVAPARIVRGHAKAVILADPQAIGRHCGEIQPPCAYEATSPNVYNQAFVFDPDGNLVFNPLVSAREGELDGALKKTYLVPEEEGPLEQGKIGLDLAYGDLRQVRPIEIAGIPMGILISKPAWMPDEIGRLEAYDARVILQPEAFSGWGSPVTDWNPDVLKQASWSQVQKHAPFRYGVLSELTGNFFDLKFDAQNFVVAKATMKQAASKRFVGQPDDVGWLEVSPWVVGDFPNVTGSEAACFRPTLEERRQCLAEVGSALAPGSGDPRENDYAEPLAVAALDLASPAADSGSRAPGVLGPNHRGDDAPSQAHARNPKIAAGPDGSFFMIWQDNRDGVDQIRIARIDPNGTVSPSRRIAPSTKRQIFPQVAVSPKGAIHVAWQELDPRPKIFRSVAASWQGSFFSPPIAVGSGSGARERWKPTIAVGDDERLHVAWIGLADGFERLFYSQIDPDPDGFSGFSEMTTPMDAEAFPAPDPLADRRNNRWSPSISARGETVAIAWTDFRNYAWDLFATVSHDRGGSFSSHLRIDDASSELERLQNDPAIEVADNGTVRVAWADQAGRRAGCNQCAKQRRPDADIAFSSLAPDAAAFSANVRVDDTGDGLETEDRIGFSNQWRPVVAEDPSHTPPRLIVVWQDHREGNNDIYLATSSDGGSSWSANQRVDDTGAGPSNQYSPFAAVASDGKVAVVWQDDRDGLEHVYWARGPSPS